MKTFILISIFCKLALALVISHIPMASAADIAKSATSADLLDPSAAFKAEIRQRDAFTAELKFEVAPGYYLYRDRIRAELLTTQAPTKKSTDKRKASVTSATAYNLALSKPAGKPIDDPTFGKVDIYDANTTMLIDLTKLGKKNQDITLTLISQGCAAVGVCFPPQKYIFNLKYQPNSLVAGSWIRPNILADSNISFGKSGLSSFPVNTAPVSSPARPAKAL
jgi:thiol:disulfide interchange protein